jgi:sulfiredoxin
MKRATLAIADIYVPVKRRATLDQKRVDEIAGSILDKGLQTPILVWADGTRFVLVQGLHRLKAAKALGEKTIVGFLVEARTSVDLIRYDLPLTPEATPTRPHSRSATDALALPLRE